MRQSATIVLPTEKVVSCTKVASKLLFRNMGKVMEEDLIFF